MSDEKKEARTFEVVIELRYIGSRGTVIRDGIVVDGGLEEATALYRRMLDASRENTITRNGSRAEIDPF